MKIQCIYRILNTANGKFYIGSASDFHKRRRYHLWQLRKGVHGNSHLQAAFNEYGEQQFKFDIIEEVDDSDQFYTEQWWLNNTYCLDPRYGYNVSKNVFPPTIKTRMKISEALTGRVFSPETRKKLSAALTGITRSSETRKKVSDAHIGKTLSLEHRKKISKSLFGKPLSTEHRKKIGAAQVGKSISLETRKKMSDAHIGRVHSPETRKKMSDSRKQYLKKISSH
jgi:group I intron endonuclease